MGRLSELLRWKNKVVLLDERKKELKTVWVRIIGDLDMQESFKLARVASANKRAALRDVDSIDYQDQIKSFEDATREQSIALIKASRQTSWLNESSSIVIRPDEVKLEEVAVDPDAPTLEEQEKLDAANNKVDQDYQQAIDDYIAQKAKELDVELDKQTLENLRILAQVEATLMLPLTVFMNELQDQKVWRSVYMDEACKERAFDGVEDFKDFPAIPREQLILAYSELEARQGDLKN